MISDIHIRIADGVVTRVDEVIPGRVFAGRGPANTLLTVTVCGAATMERKTPAAEAVLRFVKDVAGNYDHEGGRDGCRSGCRVCAAEGVLALLGATEQGHACDGPAVTRVP